MTKREERQKANAMMILRYLYENPIASQSRIAEETHLTVDQVKHCLDDLKNDEYVTHGYNVDLNYLGFKFRYRVDIFIRPSKLREGFGGLPDDGTKVDSQKSLARYILDQIPKRAPFKGKILVEDVRILLGHPADLSATVRAVDNDSMLEFVTEGLRMCQAVYQTTSCLEGWSCRHGKDF